MNIQLTIIAQGLTFAILIWFTVKFIWPPLLGAIEKRQKEIADGLAAAHEGQKALQEADLKKEEVLSGAKGKSTEIVTLAEKRANEIIKDAQEKAKIEAELIIKNAQNEVENEVNKARNQLRNELATIAIAAAEKIINKEIDKKAHTDMLSKLARDL
ncbi:MAG: F0F1 ATP synthase subunit B [Methylophilaceae bacterium]|jgi:F-type H+-transporting ATPase subunit b|nr:F0F1 ATP synthase subunit B [Methylophilaceae bacterium]MBL6728088.1 F0F1 ATP synthase subunit B [Methylophilaceae bacterium]MBL6790494.1 F0F1 ATP synthase subunit B [Methylophilaceae bacterium]